MNLIYRLGTIKYVSDWKLEISVSRIYQGIIFKIVLGKRGKVLCIQKRYSENL